MPTPQKSFLFLFCIIQWNWNRTSSLLILFQPFFVNWNECKDCRRLKDVNGTPDASFKTGWRKDTKWRLPSKYPSSWDVLRQILMTWQICSLARMQPSVWEAPVSLFEWVIKSLIQPINSRPKKNPTIYDVCFHSKTAKFQSWIIMIIRSTCQES